MPETTLNKAALRRALLADRQAIAPEVRRQWDAAIAARLVAWWEVHRVQTLGIYWPIRGEPDLHAAYDSLAARGVRLALPVVAEKDAPLGFIEWKPGDAITKDACGVSIPANGAWVRPAALLVPCVGYNDRHFRLGYGGGFYDRTLALSPRPRTVGIAYARGFAAFEADAHDVALDTIITETSSIDFG